MLSLITISLYAAYCTYESGRCDLIDDAIRADIHLDAGFMDLIDRQNVHFQVCLVVTTSRRSCVGA